MSYVYIYIYRYCNAARLPPAPLLSKKYRCSSYNCSASLDRMHGGRSAVQPFKTLCPGYLQMVVHIEIVFADSPYLDLVLSPRFFCGADPFNVTIIRVGLLQPGTRRVCVSGRRRRQGGGEDRGTGARTGNRASSGGGRAKARANAKEDTQRTGAMGVVADAA